MNKEIRPKYTLRKLSVGLASVMIGSTILLSSQQVHAADNSAATAETSTTNTTEGSETTDVKNTDTNSDRSVKSDGTSQDASSKTEVYR
ncbi:MAG: YSIRK-type signal peptide-containing protein [Lactobacillus crispatus]|nr:YSIRK-type signal peptide-containing protein [Lactobacillus crispatus]